VRVWFKTQDAAVTQQFADTVRKFPEVVECYLTTGECDAIMRVVTADLHAYWRFSPTISPASPACRASRPTCRWKPSRPAPDCPCSEPANALAWRRALR